MAVIDGAKNCEIQCSGQEIAVMVGQWKKKLITKI